MLTLYPPAIPYKKKTKDSTTIDESKFIKVEIPFGRAKNTKGTEWSIPVFDDVVVDRVEVTTISTVICTCCEGASKMWALRSVACT